MTLCGLSSLFLPSHKPCPNVLQPFILFLDFSPSSSVRFSFIRLLPVSLASLVVYPSPQPAHGWPISCTLVPPSPWAVLPRGRQTSPHPDWFLATSTLSVPNPLFAADHAVCRLPKHRPVFPAASVCLTLSSPYTKPPHTSWGVRPLYPPPRQSSFCW